MGGSAKKFEATFENGGFWEYYKDLERQFEGFLEYVPYLEGNENAYSFKLANLIVAIGAHIDSAFKEIAKYPEFSSKFPALLRKVLKGKPRTPTIEDYYVLAVEYKLPQKKIIFKRLPKRDELKPFQQYRMVGKHLRTPDWWQVYNGVKHKFKENLQKANIQNTRSALAGAFLLNVIHKPAALRLYDYGILKTRMPFSSTLGRYTTVGSTRPMVKDAIWKMTPFSGDVETSLFKYDYDQ